MQFRDLKQNGHVAVPNKYFNSCHENRKCCKYFNNKAKILKIFGLYLRSRTCYFGGSVLEMGAG